MLGWDKSSSLTFRLMEKGAFGRRGGEKRRFSAFPFLLLDLQMCGTSENQNASLSSFSHKTGKPAMAVVLLIV